VQSAAGRPNRARFGLGVAPDLSGRLEPVRNEGGAEHLKAALTRGSPWQVDAELRRLLEAAWARG
jgi:hypothetical protein